MAATAGPGAPHHGARHRSSHFPFLDLPRELRDEVYGHLIPHFYYIDRVRSKQQPYNSPGPITALLCTNQQVNNELMDRLYRSAKAPNFCIALYDSHGWYVDHGWKSVRALLPTKPILEARKLRISITIRSRTNVFVEKLEHHQKKCDDTGMHPSEWATACLPADLIHIAGILRRRTQMPEMQLRVGMSVTHCDWSLGSFPDVILRPLQELRGVPGGVRTEFFFSGRLDEGMDLPDIREFDWLVTAIQRQTSAPGRLRPGNHDEVDLLRDHLRYGESVNLYEAFNPWDNASARVETRDEMDALLAVSRLRRTREGSADRLYFKERQAMWP